MIEMGHVEPLLLGGNEDEVTYLCHKVPHVFVNILETPAVDWNNQVPAEFTCRGTGSLSKSNITILVVDAL